MPLLINSRVNKLEAAEASPLTSQFLQLQQEENTDLTGLCETKWEPVHEAETRNSLMCSRLALVAIGFFISD